MWGEGGGGAGGGVGGGGQHFSIFLELCQTVPVRAQNPYHNHEKE